VKQPKKNVHPRKIFEHAVHYHWSTDFIRRVKFPVGADDLKRRSITLLSQPVMVLQAFASELYIKCLHCIDSGTVPGGHDLESLFNHLNPLRQKAIISGWNARMAHRQGELDQRDRATKPLGFVIPRDLPVGLKECRLAFMQLRYQYEEPKKPKFYLGDLPDVLRVVILHIYPDWKTVWGPGPDTSATSRSH
jgi:hypothetical protein